MDRALDGRGGRLPRAPRRLARRVSRGSTGRRRPAARPRLTLNVLAYLTDAELDDFWAALDAILAPGGVLLASHSNELFDVFALNAGTAGFFAAHFTGGASVASLLTARGAGEAYNVRANPLTHRDELAAHGFEELARAYFNFHPLPPALLGEGDEGRVVDPDAIARVPEWKQQFQCSTLFSLARRQASRAI